MSEENCSDGKNCFVEKSVCDKTSGEIKDELKTIRVALVGKDMRGGLVKDVSDLRNTVDDFEKKESNKRSLLRDFLKSFVAPVVVALIVAGAVTGWHPW